MKRATCCLALAAFMGWMCGFAWAAPSGKPVELSIGRSYSMDYNNYGKPSNRTDWPAIRELEKRTGVKITWKMYPGNEAATLMDTELASGTDLPDIMLGGRNPDVLLSTGTIIDLMPLITAHAPNLQKLMKDYPEIVASYTLDDGRMHSFPMTITAAADNLPSVTLREDYLATLKLKEPKTVEEFTSVLRAFRDGDPDGNGVKDTVPLAMRYWWFIDYLRPGFGIYDTYFFPDKNNKIQIQLLRPEYGEYVAWLATLYKEQLVDNAAFEPGDREARVAELLKKASVGGFVWWSNSIRKDFSNVYMKKVVPNAELIVVPPPQSKFVTKVEVQRRQAVEGNVLITKSCKDPVAAIKFIDFCFSPEGSTIGQWGILGDSYTIEGGKKVITDKVNQARETDQAWYRPEAYGLRDWLTVAEWDNWAMMIGWTQKDFDSNNRLKAIATAPPPPAYLFTVRQSTLRITRMADIQTYTEEQLLRFITGMRPLTEWEAFTKDLVDKYKIKDVLDKAYQPAYDSYLKKLELLK